METSEISKLARHLMEGDVIDLKEIFNWLDLQGLGSEVSESDRVSAEYELTEVESVELETDRCLVIYNDLLNVAVDPDLMVTVIV